VSITTNNTDVRQKLKWMFRIYDIDGNGKIEKKEFKIIIGSIFKLLNSDKKKSSEHMEEIFTKFEIDKNKYITLEEFTDRCMQDQKLIKLLAPSI
jgi:Ca2+-binding EF-hand superfamily protein